MLRGTIILPEGISVASELSADSSSRIHSFSAMLPSLTSFGIDALLEGLGTQATVGVDKQFFLGTMFQEDVNNFLDHAGHFISAKRRAEYIAQRGVIGGAAAQLDLIELG